MQIIEVEGRDCVKLHIYMVDMHYKIDRNTFNTHSKSISNFRRGIQVKNIRFLTIKR